MISSKKSEFFYLYIDNIQMSTYYKLIDQIIGSSHQNKNQSQFLFRDLIAEMKLSHNQICQRECVDLFKNKTSLLIQMIIQKSTTVLFGLFKMMLEELYMKQSPLLKIVYQFVPIMLRQYIQIKDSKNTDLQQAIKVIQTNQIPKYYRYLKDKAQIHSNPFVRDLYQIHFNSRVSTKNDILTGQMDKSFQKQEIQSFNTQRQRIKVTLLYVIYRNLDCLNPKAMKQYLQTIYIYCGGDQKQYQNRSSFYHLEKKNSFNPFRYSISQQEIEWMLISLYELSIESNYDKYQLLAAINMIYKKTANESMFKYSEIAQSIIHILQDEYTDIFC